MSAHDCTQKKDPLLKSNTKILIIDLDLALRVMYEETKS